MQILYTEMCIRDSPIDLHLKGFEALGVKIEQGHGYIEATASNGLVGTTIYFDFPSVGATENVMMAAALAEGTTILENPAEEPEIVDLANYLNQMGAKIRGAGTNVIRIEGVKAVSYTHLDVYKRQNLWLVNRKNPVN